MGETRLTFLATLRAGLRGARPAVIDDAVADYASHFEVGLSKGRSEEDIALALGDPLALADELRVEMRIENWQASPTPASALKLIGGVLALGALNTLAVFVIAPVLCLLAFIALVAIAAVAVTGVWLLIAGASLGLGAATALLGGIGLSAAAISALALLTLAFIALVGGLGRYARLHYRLLPRSSRNAPETKP